MPIARRFPKEICFPFAEALEEGRSPAGGVIPVPVVGRDDEPVDLDELGPIAMRANGGGVLVVSNPPWGMRIGNRDDDRYNNRDDDRYDERDDRGAEYGDGNWDADPDAAKEAPAHVPDVEEAWQSLGTFFRRECGGATAHLLSGDANATRPLRMRARRKRVLGIGGVDCRLLEYRILPPKKEGPSLTELAQAAREEEQKEESREEEQKEE